MASNRCGFFVLGAKGLDLKQRCIQEAEAWKELADQGAYSDLDETGVRRYTVYQRKCLQRFKTVYLEFSGEELLQVLRDRAAELGRNPTTKEVFPDYHIFLRMRFKNWPIALRAAGLKPPKEKKRR